LLAIKYDKDSGGWSNWLKGDLSQVDVSDGVRTFFKEAKEDGDWWNEFDSKTAKDYFKIVDDEEIQNIIKWREELSKTDNPLKTYKENVLKADKTTNSFGKKAGNVFKSIGATLGSMAVNMGIGMIVDGVAGLIDYFTHAQERAYEFAQNFYNKTSEIVEKHKEENTQIDSLISRYEEIISSGEIDSQNREEVLKIQEQISKLVGEEASGYDLLNGNLRENVRLLKEQALLEKRNNTFSRNIHHIHALIVAQKESLVKFGAPEGSRSLCALSA